MSAQVPEKDFFVLSADTGDDEGANVKLDVTPGVCKGGEESAFLWVQNTSPLPATLEPGQWLGVGELIPPGTALLRR